MIIRIWLRKVATNPETPPATAETCRTLLTLLSAAECETDADICALMIGVISAQRDEITELQRKDFAPCR